MRWMGGIAGRLALFVSLVALVATATVGYMVYRGARDSLMQSSFDRVEHTAETVRVRMWATLGAIGDDVKFLSATPAVQGIVRATMQGGLDPEWTIYDDEWGTLLAEICRSFLETRSSYLDVRFVRLLNDELTLVRVERRNGQVVFADVESLGETTVGEFVRSTSNLTDGSIHLSDLGWSGEEERFQGNSHVLRFGTPIYTPDGQVFGVIAVTVDTRKFLEPLTSIVDEHQTLYVATRQGELLHVSGRAAPERDGESARLQHLFPSTDELVIGGEASEIQMLDVPVGRQKPGIGFFEHVSLDASGDAPPLVVGVTEPHETILAGVRSVRNQSALITLLLCLAAVGVALTASRYLTKPIRQITRAVSSFGGHNGDDTATLPVERTDEIGLLARSFEAMEKQIEDQITVLENEEERQRTILETSAEGIIVTDAEGRIEEFNPAAEHIFGCKAENVVGCKVGSMIQADIIAMTEKATQSKRVPGVESVGTRRDGTKVPLYILWSTFEWSGEPKITIFTEDISGRKEAEEAREQLFRELEEERASLRDLSLTLEARVRERTADLERLNRELEISNRELREIANVASHDLQEPLRKLRSFADLLESEYGEVLDEEGRFYAQRIFGLSERMSRLINDLLAFSRVTSKSIPYEKVDLGDVAREVVSRLEGTLKEKGGAVHFESLPEVEADPLQMQELFEKLIENALSYRRPDVAPRVQIRGSIQNDAVDNSNGTICVLEFEDNGMGFDEKYAGRIFAPFERLHKRQSTHSMGMGLTICRRIADHHRGAITARSTPGKGSTFVVTLPVRQRARTG